MEGILLGCVDSLVVDTDSTGGMNGARRDTSVGIMRDGVKGENC